MPARSTTAALIAVTALIAAALAIPPSAVAASLSPRAVPDTAPTWQAKTASIGHVASTAKVSARIYLAPRGGLAALAAAATAASTPSSADYGHFLSEAQYEAAYEPTAGSVSSLSTWLASKGFHVAQVAANNQYLSVTGTAAAATKAFGTHIDSYRLDGAKVEAPTSTLTVPANLASSVLTVTGLDTSVHKVAPTDAADVAPPPAGFNNAQPCSRYYGQLTAEYEADYKTKLPRFRNWYLPYAVCGYNGVQLRAAYEGSTDYTGKGVTVAIVDAYASPTMSADAQQYATTNGDGSYAAGQYTQTVDTKYTHTDDGPTGCDENGWYGEQTLDVEAVHAMAPEADIRYYGAASCYDNDFINALSKIVTEDKAQIVTDSWGEVEEAEGSSAIAAYEAVFLQGAMEGITFTFSSGDDGDELASSGTVQADYPTSDPYVTSVGGTSAAIGPDGTLDFQTGWGTDKYSLTSKGTWAADGYDYGSGGGASSLFDQPAYQTGIAPGPSREVPDVAMDADPTTGMLVGETQVFGKVTKYAEYRIGGTSLASPLFAGMTALKIEHSGHGLGLLNPEIYAHLTQFTDVTNAPTQPGNVRPDYVDGVDGKSGIEYSVRTFGNDASLKTSKGWDDVTGVGTPNHGWLAAVPAKS
jgi:subtilase family serine protease